MTHAQQMTLDAFHRTLDYCTTLQYMEYDSGRLMLIVSDDGPAPNPVVCVYHRDGRSWPVTDETSYCEALSHFGHPNDAIVRRQDDDVYLVQTGGSYKRLN